MEQAPRIVVHVDERDLFEDTKEECRRGLLRSPKELPPKFFYDETGSVLFERITALPEYYQTRTERRILEEIAVPLAESHRFRELLEFGSGSSRKTRVLLDQMHARGDLRLYLPFDVSEQMLRMSADELAADYPEMQIHGIVGDFTRHLGEIPRGDRRLLAFLGGTIGNFRPEEATQFLRRIAETMGPDDRLLLGTDLIKDRDLLEAAYNDSQGITARFNLNALAVINDRLDADFDLGNFDHVAFYDADREWIEMRLRARRSRRVRVGALGLEVGIEAGEEILTEISRKFSRESAGGMLADAGLELTEWFTDPGALFALALARRVG